VGTTVTEVKTTALVSALIALMMDDDVLMIRMTMETAKIGGL